MALVKVEHGMLDLHSPYKAQGESETQFKVTATTYRGEEATFMTKSAALHWLSMDADVHQGKEWREGVAASINID